MIIAIFWIVYYVFYISTLVIQTVLVADFWIAWVLLLTIKIIVPLCMLLYHKKSVESYIRNRMRNRDTTYRFVMFVTIEITEAVGLFIVLLYVFFMGMKGDTLMSYMTLFGVIPLMNLVIKVEYWTAIMVRYARDTWKYT
jgi:hypothetical protein